MTGLIASIPIKQLLIVIVLYNEDLFECAAYKSLLSFRAGFFKYNVFIYDNSVKKQFAECQLSLNGIGYIYIHDSKNSGISKAYNSAGNYATKNGFEWLLFLDQDTSLPPDILDDYFHSILSNSEINLFVPLITSDNLLIISPFKKIINIGFPIKKVVFGIKKIKDFGIINSGMMVSVEAFINSGGYNEKVKLDFSDSQFISRYEKKYELFFVMSSKCIQNLSTYENDADKTLKRFEFFCKGAKNYHCTNFIEHFSIFVILLKRIISLTIKYRSLVFVRLAIRYYRE